jgi:hypothetical protein
MTFLFKRKQYEYINPYLLEDIENRIIEIDDLEPNLEYNEHDQIDQQSFKNFHDLLIQGMFIMAIGSLCLCLLFLSILYPLTH